MKNYTSLRKSNTFIYCHYIVHLLSVLLERLKILHA